MQVVLQLTTDLDGHCERDRNCLNSLLAAIVDELQLNKMNDENVYIRTKHREVQLVLMRLLSKSAEFFENFQSYQFFQFSSVNFCFYHFKTRVSFYWDCFFTLIVLRFFPLQIITLDSAMTDFHTV